MLYGKQAQQASEADLKRHLYQCHGQPKCQSPAHHREDLKRLVALEPAQRAARSEKERAGVTHENTRAPGSSKLKRKPQRTAA